MNYRSRATIITSQVQGKLLSRNHAIEKRDGGRALSSTAAWKERGAPFDYQRDLPTFPPAGKITQIREFRPAAWAKAKEKMLAQAA
jgi:hypothetical protein